MNKQIKIVIDNLIREHKTVINNEYFCEVDDLSLTEVKDLVNILWNKDESFQSYIKDYIHDLLESRIGFVQSTDNYESGLVPIQDQINGEITWRNVGGYDDYL
jgi:hypothetical protein